MEFQPARVEIVFHSGGTGLPLEFKYWVDSPSKTNKEYFSQEHVKQKHTIWSISQNWTVRAHSVVWVKCDLNRGFNLKEFKNKKRKPNHSFLKNKESSSGDVTT